MLALKIRVWKEETGSCCQKDMLARALYSVLADKGYFDVCMLDTLNRPEERACLAIVIC